MTADIQRYSLLEQQARKARLEIEHDASGIHGSQLSQFPSGLALANHAFPSLSTSISLAISCRRRTKNLMQGRGSTAQGQADGCTLGDKEESRNV
jgi:hypothetical protein